MKFTLILLISLFAASLAQNNEDTYLPVAIASKGRVYVTFGSYLYDFYLPTLETLRQQNYSQNAISYPPVSINNNTLYLGDGMEGSFEIDLDTLNLTQRTDRAPLEGQPITGSLLNIQNEYCVTDSSNTTTFCFQGGNPATITKTINGQEGNTTVTLGNYTATRFLKVDETAGLLHLTAEVIQGRGGENADYWTFPLQGDFQIQTGPVTLNNTALSGCPVAPRGCGVAVLIYEDAFNGTLIYLWTIARAASNDTEGNATAAAFEVHVVAYNQGFNEIYFDNVNYTPTLVTGGAPTESSDESASASDSPSDAVSESNDGSDSSVGDSSDSGVPESSAESPVVEER